MSTTVTLEETSLSSSKGAPPQTVALKSLPVDNTLGSEEQLFRDVSENQPAQWKIAVILTLVSLMYMISTVLSGILAVGLPKIAKSINLDEGLLLWPASVYSLSCGCTLLLSGSVADVVGCRRIYLLGSFLSTCLILACGLARDGMELIIFRALQGVAISLCLPGSVSIVTKTFPLGRMRNIAFACLGAAQPTGFLIGLIIGGILIDSIGWRTAMYLIAGINAGVFVVSCFFLPSTADDQLSYSILRRFREDVDWIGVSLISVAFGLLSYVLSAICARPSSISTAANIALLVVSLVLILAFLIWEHYQEKFNRPALIPNSIWRNPIFTSTCIMVFFAWATVTTNQYFLALFFEEVQGLSAFQTSLRFLPLVVSGVLTNIATGALVRHVRADILIGVSVLLSAATPLIMALVVVNHSQLPYWAAAFPAAILSPIWADVTLTIANLVITQLFPRSLHGLAGGVSNTCAQLGTSIGLNLTAILANAVTMSSTENKSSPVALAEGYSAAFWASFGATVAMILVTVLGMRTAGKVGRPKHD
ncbi:hypothetical protein N7501_007416 [Penicillium viridicatum]|nr:hypothetical protein N7501_007416 [Penicillium viridicatum]